MALSLTMVVQPVGAVQTIYIMEDGSIDPSTAPISTIDNVTYTFVDNIDASIVVQRNDIIIDGARHALQGNRTGNGVYLTGRSNITLRNMRMTFWESAFSLDDCRNVTVSGNNIQSNKYGIWVNRSSDITISNNLITCSYGLEILHGSHNVMILGNLISGRIIFSEYKGIDIFFDSYNVTISRNFLGYDCVNINIWDSHDIAVFGNTIQGEMLGMFFSYVENLTFYHNSVRDKIAWLNCSRSSWDDGYPNSGNYWDNYSGSDLFGGPYQNLTGSDGIGDTPYVIDANNQDNYPLMTPIPPIPWEPWDITGWNKWVSDNFCDMRDLAQVAQLYGSTASDRRYDRRADITGEQYLVPDGKVDIRDMALIAKHYGESYQLIPPFLFSYLVVTVDSNLL